MLIHPIASASAASPAASRRGASKAAASMGIGASQAAGHHGCRPSASEMARPDNIAAIRRLRGSSRGDLAIGADPQQSASMEQREENFGENKKRDRDLEEQQPAIARDIDYQFQRLLNAAQLELHGGVAVR